MTPEVWAVNWRGSAGMDQKSIWLTKGLAVAETIRLADEHINRLEKETGRNHRRRFLPRVGGDPNHVQIQMLFHPDSDDESPEWRTVGSYFTRSWEVKGHAVDALGAIDTVES